MTHKPAKALLIAFIVAVQAGLNLRRGEASRKGLNPPTNAGMSINFRSAVLRGETKLLPRPVHEIESVRLLRIDEKTEGGLSPQGVFRHGRPRISAILALRNPITRAGENKGRIQWVGSQEPLIACLWKRAETLPRLRAVDRLPDDAQPVAE
jgi:hypothetical protein